MSEVKTVKTKQFEELLEAELFAKKKMDAGYVAIVTEPIKGIFVVTYSKNKNKSK